MVQSHIIVHALIYNIVMIGSLVIIMMSVPARVWGYSDYSKEIKAKVPPQTKKEKRLAAIIGVPWILFGIGFPIISTLLLENKLGSEIPFWTAFLNIFIMVFLANLIDLVVLDWLIVSKITPSFVMIPGTEKADYDDFSFHYKAQLVASVVLLGVTLIGAFLFWYF